MPVETLQTTVRLRPTRIGFVVNPGDRESVLRIMRYCAVLWGGKFNPIIPNSRLLPKAWRSKLHPRPSGSELCKRYLSFFEPDVFVTATDRSLPPSYCDDKLAFRHSRVRDIENFVTGDDRRAHDFAFGLNMFDVFRHLYREEFKFVHRHEETFVRTDPSANVDTFFVATAGAFPNDNDLSYLIKAYDDIFDPELVESDVMTMEKLIRREISTPLDLTTFLIDVHTRHWQGPLMFVFNPDVTEDLIDYWNLRIIVRHVIPVNVHWFEQVSGLIGGIIESNYRPLPGNSHGVMIRTTLEFASSIDQEQAESLTRGLRDLPQGSWSMKLWYTPLWDRNDDERIARPTKTRLTAASKDTELLFADSSLIASFETLSPAFADDFGGGRNAARWVNVLGLRSIRSDSLLALCFPIKARVADFPKLTTLRKALVSREGIALFQSYKDSRDWLEWMQGGEAIVAWLDAHGIEAAPSDAGRTAGEIIKAVGDLHGVRLFAHEETIRKLNDMASRRAREPEPGNGESTKEYPDRTASVAEWKSLISQRSNKSRLGSVILEKFVMSNVLRLVH